MRLTRRMGVAAIGLTLAVSAGAFTTGQASAAVAPAGVARASALNAAASSSTGDNLYACRYTVKYDNISEWEWPGGGPRGGNHINVTVLSGIGFNAIPWIAKSSGGQSWIYGAMLIPGTSGIVANLYGWVGRNYLTAIGNCGTSFFETSNKAIEHTNVGEVFNSIPWTDSGAFRGQDWIWGRAANSTSAGWIGRSYLNLTSCDATNCYYTIKYANITGWVLPGGASGP
jgi:hypothetical protein